MTVYITSILGALAATAGLSLLLGYFVIAWLRKKSINDGAPRKASDTFNEMNKGKARTPTMGGLFIIASIAVCSLVGIGLWLTMPTATFEKAAPALIALAAMLGSAALGAFDDWAKLKRTGKDGISARAKLAAQLVLYTACAVSIWAFTPAHQQVLWIPVLNAELPLGWLMIPLGVFVMTGTSNAVNLSDGLDGLAGGMTVMVALAFAVLGVAAVDGASGAQAFAGLPMPASGALTGILAAIVAGSVLGFLWYNKHPAKVFMGDTGSLALGAGLGAIAMAMRVELLLAVAGVVFVAEAGSVILQVGYFKATKGKRIFKCSPLHHHFQFSGWKETTVTRRFWAATALACVIALALPVLFQPVSEAQAPVPETAAAPDNGTKPETTGVMLQR